MDFGLKLKKEKSGGVGVTVEVRLHRFQECCGPCGGPCMGWADRLVIPGCSVRRTYEVWVKPFGNTVKKEVRM